MYPSLWLQENKITIRKSLSNASNHTSIKYIYLPRVSHGEINMAYKWGQGVPLIEDKNTLWCPLCVCVKYVKQFGKVLFFFLHLSQIYPMSFYFTRTTYTRRKQNNHTLNVWIIFFSLSVSWQKLDYK